MNFNQVVYNQYLIISVIFIFVKLCIHFYKTIMFVNNVSGDHVLTDIVFLLKLFK